MITTSTDNYTIFGHQYGNYSIKTAVIIGNGRDVIVELNNWYTSRHAESHEGWRRRGIGWPWIVECWRCGCRLFRQGQGCVKDGSFKYVVECSANCTGG
jgi:hypothetical protein